MYFHLRSEIERIDTIKDYIVKRVFCPSCGKIQIKKIDTNHYYTKYQCWNKNCEEKDKPFMLINDYLKEEKVFNGTCESCDQDLYRDFIETDDFNYKLIFKCLNDNCDESNYELSYNFETEEWIKRDILSDSEFQYIHWYLYRKPGKKEFNILNSFFEGNEFKVGK